MRVLERVLKEEGMPGSRKVEKGFASKVNWREVELGVVRECQRGSRCRSR